MAREFVHARDGDGRIDYLEFIAAFRVQGGNAAMGELGSPMPFSVASSLSLDAASSLRASQARDFINSKTAEIKRELDVLTAGYQQELGAQGAQVSGTVASALPIEGRQLLTNAHAVANARLIHVRRSDGHSRFVASVFALCFESDLALLRVLEEAFWEGLRAVAFRVELPRLQEEVTVVGRVVCEGEGRLNASSLFLEASRASANALRCRVLCIAAAHVMRKISELTAQAAEANA